MDMNDYAIAVLARDRLAEMRAAGERWSRIRIAKPRSRPLRVALGHLFIRVGRRLHSGWGCSLLAPGVGNAVEAPRISTPEVLRG
jgi:hypothetical protein